MNLQKQMVITIGILFVANLADLARAQQVTTIDFTDLVFPDGTFITNEFQSEGVIFTDDDTGIDVNFPCFSLVGQENVAIQGEFNNPFRVIFVTFDPVVGVRVTLRDNNANDQIHGLYELDADLNVVQAVTFDDVNGPFSQFTLQLANPSGIAGVGICEQPFGNEKLISMTLVFEASIFSDGFESGDLTLWSSVVQ